MSRGRQAYHETKQVLIYVSGKVKGKCQERKWEVIYHLRGNKQSLSLDPYVWREAYDFSEGGAVLSSQIDTEEEYIRY